MLSPATRIAGVPFQVLIKGRLQNVLRVSEDQTSSRGGTFRDGQHGRAGRARATRARRKVKVFSGITLRSTGRKRCQGARVGVRVSGFINAADHTRSPALGSRGRRRGRRSIVLNSKLAASSPLKVGMGLRHHMSAQKQIMPCPLPSSVTRSARCP